MDNNNIPQSEDVEEAGSIGYEYMRSGSESVSNIGSKRDGTGDDQNSQDDVKSESASMEPGSEPKMELRERRKRKVTTYRYSPDLEPAPAPTIERRSSAKSNDKSSNAKNELSHWLQCDSCHKWRIVATVLFNDLKKLEHFTCRNLQGVTCKDRDDWAAGNDSMTGSDGGSSTIKEEYRSIKSRQGNSRTTTRRINIFAGNFIPGFAGEFSEEE